MPAGRVTKLWEDDIGLRYRAKLNLKTDWGRNAYEALLAGDVDANSIGYNNVKGKSVVNDDDGVTDLNGINLMEISTVTFPSNEEAVNDYVKSDIEPDEVKAGRTISSATRTQLVAARDVLNILIGETPAEPAAPAPPGKSEDTEVVETVTISYKDGSPDQELLIKRLEHIKEILE